MEPRRRPLLIRVDASPDIGSGHLMRCIALAQAWSAVGGEVAFAIHRAGAPWEDRLAAAGHSVHWLDRSVPDEADLSMTLALARNLGTDWLVLDGYHFDPAYQKAVRRTGLRLLVIDDIAHHGMYFADLLVNQNLEAESFRYRVLPGTSVLIGPRYALLRSEFERWRGWQRPIAPDARRVLVTLGGGDAGDVTDMVTDELEEFPEFEVRIILGAGHHRYPDARRVAPREGTRYLRDVSTMAEHMAWADVAISGSGTTAWELAFMGLPSLLLTLAPNQGGIALALSRLQVAESVGAPARGALVDALRRLVPDVGRRTLMSVSGRKLVDGEGARRVVAAMRESLSR